MKRTVIGLIALFLHVTLMAQERELLIIGTMHTVPKIVRNSYRPLLKYATLYHPDAILTEDNLPDDTLSMRIYTPRFLAKAQEARKKQQVDEEQVKRLLSKPLQEMSQQDFLFLKEAFLCKRDRANSDYYDYLATYGLKGSKKPLRNESDDVTHKLAIRMSLRKQPGRLGMNVTGKWQRISSDSCKLRTPRERCSSLVPDMSSA